MLSSGKSNFKCYWKDCGDQFAPVSIDQHGGFQFDASPSIFDAEKMILSIFSENTFSSATNECRGVNATSLAGNLPPLLSSLGCLQPGIFHSNMMARNDLENDKLGNVIDEGAGEDRDSTPNSPSSRTAKRKLGSLVHGEQVRQPQKFRETTPPLVRKRSYSQTRENVPSQGLNCSDLMPKETMIQIMNTARVRRYYECAFESLQQLNCRIIAKAWIKYIEPCKKGNHPYNGRKLVGGRVHQLNPELTKPDWWPPGVTHREPDHLLKAERVKLLIHMLCELRVTHAITVEKLKHAAQSTRWQIQPSRQLELLDEIFYLRQVEEKFLAGDIDGDTVVCVSKAQIPEGSFIYHSYCGYGSDLPRSSSPAVFSTEACEATIEKSPPCTPTHSNASSMRSEQEGHVPEIVENAPEDQAFPTMGSQEHDICYGLNSIAPFTIPSGFRLKEVYHQVHDDPVYDPTSDVLFQGPSLDSSCIVPVSTAPHLIGNQSQINELSIFPFLGIVGQNAQL